MLPTFYSFLSLLLPSNDVALRFCFALRPKRFVPFASASQHVLLRRIRLEESLGTTVESSIIGLGALYLQSYCRHHPQEVVLLDDHSSEDILVSCGMIEDKTSCAAKQHSPVIKVNLHSQSIYFLLEIFEVVGEVLQWVDTKTGIRRMDVLDAHTVVGGAYIP